MDSKELLWLIDSSHTFASQICVFLALCTKQRLL